MPKLLVLTSTLPRWTGDTEPRFVEYLSYELARSMDVTVLAPHCAGAARAESFSNGDQTIAVNRFTYFIPALQSLAYDGGILSRLRRNPLRILLVPFFLLAQLIAVSRLHQRHEFDAIHAHWIVPQGLVAAMFRTLSRRPPPLLITSHGGDLFALRGVIMTWLKRWILRRATKVAVVSEAMRAQGVALTRDADKVSVNSMGVDLRGVFTPGDQATERSGLVFVGRLVEKKGVSYLVAAMAQLIKRFPDLQLAIIGDGPDREALTRQTSDSRLQDNIQFLGSVPNVELPAQLRKAKIAVMPSIVAASGDQEGLGLVAVEAMGCGCAVVASDLPAVRDTVVNGETGMMARPADAGDLANVLAQLLDDDEKCRALADRGRQYAITHFDWRTIGDNYAALILGMLDS